MLQVTLLNGATFQVHTRDFHKKDTTTTIKMPNGQKKMFANWYVVSDKPV